MITCEGLQDHQVVQRESATTATVRLRGTSDGPVRLRVVDPSGRPATAWEPAGSGGPWKVELTVPVGGPYDLVARDGEADDQVLVRHVLVGDLWLLAGQSNMQGCGRIDAHVECPSPRTAVLDMARRWRPAVDPLHRLSMSPDVVHTGTDDPAALQALRDAEAEGAIGASLGVAFANAMVDATDVPVGLIATAHGGTSLSQWSPDLRHEGGRSLFGSMLLSLEAAGGRIAGALWYQGESDALGLQSEQLPARLQELVQVLREELGQPDLPFFHVQLGRVCSPFTGTEAEPHWTAVREHQRTVDLGPGGVTTAVDLALDDPIHISTRSLRRLGRRLALLASGNGSTIRLESVRTEVLQASVDGGPDVFEIRVAFTGAAEPLVPAEHITGFSLRSPAGESKPGFFRAAIDPSSPSTVVLRGCARLEDGDALFYGHGFDPTCNLVDAQDQAVPAFGPVVLEPEGVSP